MRKNLFEMGAKFEDGWSFEDEKKKILTPKEHSLTIQKQKRKNKIVTIVGVFFLETKELKKLLKELKSHFGVGGTIKQNSIELQGDHATVLKELLKSKNFRFKK